MKKKKTIWIEPCACELSTVTEKGKDKVRYRHNKVNIDGEPTYSPLQGQTEGWDADGAPVSAEYRL